MSGFIVIGYSGHAFVVLDIIEANGHTVVGYCENEEKLWNPYNLPFLGNEMSKEGLAVLRQYEYFIAIGSNPIRKKVYDKLLGENLQEPAKIIHPSATISPKAVVGAGTMVAAQVAINALAHVGKGVICNTNCIIEHECEIGNFVHIAPGAVLAGNVKIGAGTFVGANAVVKQGVSIGEGVTIGAGTVVLKDVADGIVLVGNPGKQVLSK
ncbi:MAG: acetyltransferase [Saprospiraceae bacterium]|nr:acetyltransferase [Saprospiraceae bacterium]